MLSIQRWIKKYVGDVFDESNDISDGKYQLIYSIGAQQYKDVIYKESERQSNFSELCTRIVNDWIEDQSYRQIHQSIV